MSNTPTQIGLGYETPGFFTVPQLFGPERIPMDTEYPEGIAPQTAAVTVAQLAAQGGGNNGVASGFVGTATAVAGAAILDASVGVITTESLTTAAAATYTLTLTNSVAIVGSAVQATIGNGTNSTAGTVISATASLGAVTFAVTNVSAAALNGTLLISYSITN